MNKNKVAVITGASSGIGKETALLLKSKGYIVFGGSRKIENDSSLNELGIFTKNLDVTNSDSISSFVDFITANTSHIDVLINCAGYGSYGPIEEVTIKEAKNQMNVNVFGLIEVIQAFLPYMRNQRNGKIINISSVAGRTFSYFGGWYHASKWSVEVLSDCLSMELKPFNIQVALIEPGLIKTPWGTIAAEHLQKVTKDTVYEQQGQVVAQYLYDTYTKNQNLTDPKEIAKVIFKACEAEKMKRRYLTGYMAKELLIAYKLLNKNTYSKLIQNKMCKEDK